MAGLLLGKDLRGGGAAPTEAGTALTGVSGDLRGEGAAPTEAGSEVIRGGGAAATGRWCLLSPAVFQAHGQIKHGLGALHVVDAVCHKVAVPLELEVLAGQGVGQ